MRLRISALPVALLVAGTAVAQAGNAIPNAVRAFRTDAASGNSTFWTLGTTAGNTSAAVWACLPSDLLTYFRAQPGAQRALDFRGLEFDIAVFVTNNYTLPPIAIRYAVEAGAPNQGRLLPDLVNAALVTFPAAPQGVLAPFLHRRAYDLGPGNAVGIPFTNPNTSGQGLAVYVTSYESQFGGGGFSPTMTWTTGFEDGPQVAQCLSGVKFQNNATQFWLDQIGGGTSGEMRFTWFFEQSMIQWIKNPILASSTSFIIGSGTTVNPVPFHVIGNDGRGSRLPTAGDWVSYSANGNYTNPVGATTGNVWFVPFQFFEGDITSPGTTPTPENWVGQAGGPQNAYIHSMSLQKWVDDLLFIFNGNFNGNGTGAVLNPNNSTLGLWLGVDLPFFLDPNVLVNAFQLSDATNLPGSVGVEAQAYNSVSANAAIFGRNLDDEFGLVGEHGALIMNQVGYSMIGVGTGPPSLPLNTPVGIGQVPANPSLIGLTYYLTAWRLGVPGIFGPNYVIPDMTNVIRLTIS